MSEYRDHAAHQLAEADPEDRRGLLEEMRKDEEYWIARSEKLKERQKAEWEQDRGGFHWRRKHLFYGSPVEHIDTLRFAEESTIGAHAVYFSLDPTLAMGYAHLRRKEGGRDKAFLYEVALSDVNIMNWAQNDVVDTHKEQYAQFCKGILEELNQGEYGAFVKKYGLPDTVDQGTARYALEKIVATCEREGFLCGGNVKTVAQGVMGYFFQCFVTESGYDGVITIEGGDDSEYTAKPGASVVLYNREKIESHRAADITRVEKPTPGVV